VSAPVTRAQRFLGDRSCPVCGGAENDPRGEGRRCFGYRLQGDRSSVCTRAEYAGSLRLAENLRGYVHTLDRLCRCGVDHHSGPVAATNGTHPPNRNGHARKIVERYDYADETAAALFQVVRFEPKGFQQRRRHPVDGRWMWGIGEGMYRRNGDAWRRVDSGEAQPGDEHYPAGRLVLYGLPALKDQPEVCVVEGERDVHTLRELGLIATTCPMGAGKWRSEYVDQLLAAGVQLVNVFRDGDEPGERHARSVEAACVARGLRVRSVHLPGDPQDVTAWRAASHSADDLRAVIAAAPFVTANAEAAPDKGAPRGLVFTTLGALLSEPTETTSWLVDKHLPMAGLSLIAGKPKAGKSTLARCLALAVARGLSWLGMPTVQGDVLYLALEEKRDEVRAHFAAMGADSANPVHIYCAPSPQDGLEQLRAAADRYRPVLIIIDPLFRFIRVPDSNDYAVVSAALEPLLTLARETKAHVMAVHHMGKGERTGGDAILGSTAIFGSVDTALLLRRSEHYRLLSSVQRYGTDLDEMTIALDPNTRTISAGPSREAADQARAETDIVDYLRTAQQPQPAAVIQEAVECRRQTFQRALKALVPHRVTRTGEGKNRDPFLYAFAGEKTADGPVSESGSQDIAGNPGTTFSKQGLSADQIKQQTGSQVFAKNNVVPSDLGNHINGSPPDPLIGAVSGTDAEGWDEL
jgi:AAA domain